MSHQISFDPLDWEDAGWPPAAARDQAEIARNELYRKLRKQRVECWRWVLKGQLRPWRSFGRPDGRLRDVFYLNTAQDVEYTKEVVPAP